ncbi:hypothetical protein C806_00627 [Lachnospiraceae bacterium 3-1]|nr:hypothetical protein C806_00627 [Lachnospiraceae bacterium 3-1]
METLHKEEKQVWIREELKRCLKVLDRNMARFGEEFPSACAEHGRYKITPNHDWTNGFWTGMLWIAYEFSGRQVYKELALKNIESFRQRLQEHYVLDHHDIGFLYSLSVVAGHRILKEEELKPVIVWAADVLAARFQEKGGFIQAWGKLGADHEYRLIIDSLLNLPLLYEAYRLTGKESYQKIADSHYSRVIHNIVREDFSTYHTFYFSKETGNPDHGATYQGYSDNSCWARGQAWAILGMPLHARTSGNAFTEEEAKLYEHVVEYFESHLPSDGMPYWDLVFGEGSDMPRDSSALAIAACGMLEMGRIERAKEMIQVLKNMASSEAEPESEGLLLHSVYTYRFGEGVDEPSLWGDYFYLEALYRLWNPDWGTYW